MAEKKLELMKTAKTKSTKASIFVSSDPFSFSPLQSPEYITFPPRVSQGESALRWLVCKKVTWVKILPVYHLLLLWMAKVGTV